MSESAHVSRKLVSFNIRKLRRKRNLSQQELATASELTRAYIGRIESKTQNLTLDTIDALADALNVHPRDFFRQWDPDPTSRDKAIFENLESLVISQCGPKWGRITECDEVSMLLDKVPEELPEDRQEQWCAALRILDSVMHESGFLKGIISAYAGMELLELVVRNRDGELVLDGPEPVGSGSVTDSWFACHLEVEIRHLDLQRLSEWMESWGGYDQVFVPALLVDGPMCRSHRAGDSEHFTFVWE